jgi:predicted regulator of Ras-like GTPase activity (Roadblock/LC7/MglB family)
MSKNLVKSSSTAALIAVAGLLVGGAAAQAADLGGNCCADLEERVAELEATAARKGNRKVSLTVSGQVNQAVIFWNDGHERNAYVVDNNTSRSVFRFNGNAKVTSDVSAGYLLEIGARFANSQNRSQNADLAGGNSNTLDIRHSAWYIDSKSMGRVWVGKTSQATDGIVEINLANTLAANNVSYWNGGFFLRNNNAARTSAVTWSGLYSPINGNMDGDRANIVKYVSPTVGGFIASASWGEDDRVDAALRYAGEFSGFRLAAGIGYQKFTDFNATADGGAGCSNPGGSAAVSNVNCSVLGMSGSVLHSPTGLFVTGAYSTSKDNNLGALTALTNVRHPTNDTNKMVSMQAGIEQKFIGLGKTTVYGEYVRLNQGNGLNVGALRTIAAADVINASGAAAFLASSEVKVWGIGLNQSIEAASADFYLSVRNYSASLTTVNAAGAAANNTGVKDFQAVMSGMVIKF